MPEIEELKTKEAFTEFIATGKVVVDFAAEWCGPCQKIKPKFKEFAGEFETSIKFGRVDVDENSGAAEEANVTAMPTFVLYLNGAKYKDLVGANEAKLKQLLDELSKA